jgi:Spy/CpxP family protein refolding chaperone
MSLRTKFFAGIIAISAFAVASYAQEAKPEVKADGAKVERKHGPGMFGGRMGQFGRGGLFGIELTDAQKEQIRKIHWANVPDKAAIEELRTLMKAKWEGTLTDAQKARIDALKAEAMTKAKTTHEQILAVLTPEQKAQLEQRKQEMKQHMTEMHQKMMEFHQKMKDFHQKAAEKPATTNPTKDK